MEKHLRSVLFACLSLTLALALGCSGSGGPPRQATSPVTGEVIVDGKPAPNVQVELRDVTKLETEGASSTAYTDENGKFKMATYASGDGAPEGDYVATFMWGELDLFNKQYAGPDKLKEKYRDPKTSTFKIKVEKGKSADMGRIELKTN